MSYNGTVRCGYCYQEGHNKAGCAKRKEDAKTCDYTARNLKHETLRRAESVKRRRCSYCEGDERGGKTSHNRRGCKIKKSDMAITKERNIEYRNIAASKIKEAGLGPGALVEMPYLKNYHSDDGATTGKLLYLVEKIHWNHLTHRLLGRVEDGSDERLYHLDSSEKSVVDARLVSWELPDDIEEKDYWFAQSLQPMKPARIEIQKFYLEGLSPGPDCDGMVKYDYDTVPVDAVQAKVVSGVPAESIEKSIPKDYYDGEISELIVYRLNFDNEGPRRVRYGNSP